ncbi:hypothetical protein RND71_036382 [Anisodus tanguticus]|uniref:GTD-binding domain-containing protein n=1 Tax=Anisodus tanguticus TaxID=243964 RepID=A0AAE1R1D7_9SOLA|nr:hypothetical protein RND71_036382 [Anisodus tanguticus]
MSRFDVESLRETLCVQEQLIEKLYNELDEESEASASAASEALSMILRLQGEKAAEEMEAEQYKRFVEEKMSHAEESLSILQELINQKEMEKVALDYQANAYRYKLLSMGYDDDTEASDIEFLDNLNEEMKVQSIGRCRSDPNIPFKYANMKKGEYISPQRDLNDVSAAGSINLYCEQIEKLEERVKQIAGANYEKLSSLPASKRSSCNNFLEQFKETNLVQHRGYKPDNGAASGRSASPPNVLDVVEVPRAIKDEDFVPKEAEKKLVEDATDWHKKYLVPMQHENKSQLEICPTSSVAEAAENRHVKRTTFEIAEVDRQGTSQELDRHNELMLLHDIKEQLNLVPMQHDNKSHLEICPTTSASETAEIRRVNRTMLEMAEVERQVTRQEPDIHDELMLLHDIKEQLNLVPMQHENKLLRVGEAASPTTSASQTAIHCVNRTSEIAEVERQSTRQESDRYDELMLLRDIKEQLNLMQSEIKTWKTNKSSPRYEPSVVSLIEVPSLTSCIFSFIILCL